MSDPRAVLHGVLGEFRTPEELLAACRAAREAGYTCWDAHSPFPIDGLQRAMGLPGSRVSIFVLVLGLAGGAAGMLLQWWTSVIASPLAVSGKPLFSWPAFVPIAFETAVLGGAAGAVLGFLLLARLPRPYHPLFRSARFERVTDDRFFLAVEARDPRFQVEEVQRMLHGLGALGVELIHE